MKTLKNICCFAFIMLMFAVGGLSYHPPFLTNAGASLYSGTLNNQVIFVSYKDGDEDWINKPHASSNSTPLQLLQKSYNDSVMSIENFYKIQSYGKLDLKSHFITNNGKAIKIPYKASELTKYSLTNPEGYLEYNIRGKTKPSHEHIFSAYDCKNYYHDGNAQRCDLDYESDGIACLCAFYKLQETRSDVYKEEHAEHDVRGGITLKYILNQVDFEGEIDINNDGEVDAITFIFEKTDKTIDWGDLLWAHTGGLSLYNYIWDFDVMRLDAVRDIEREDIEELGKIASKKVYKNEKWCEGYNLTTYKDWGDVLQDSNGEEILSNRTASHELGHVLGLPDYYVYNSFIDPCRGWDLMAGGGGRKMPYYLTTYSREKLGFLEEENIQKITSEGVYKLKPTTYDEVHNNGQNSKNVLAYTYEDPDQPRQKIYFEYRNSEGDFDRPPSSGLTMYLIDDRHGNTTGFPYRMFFYEGTKALNQNSQLKESTSLTFQVMDSQGKTTLENSGLKVSFVKVENGELYFKITGGKLAKSLDVSQFYLNGESSVTSEVKQEYVDLGICDLSGAIVSGELENFTIKINNYVDANHVGIYNYEYVITSKENPINTITLVREVVVQDTTAPEISLIGEARISMYPSEFARYSDTRVNVSDNYCQTSQIRIKTRKAKISDKLYHYYYKAVDEFGNESQEIYRVVDIIEKKVTSNQLSLSINNNVVLDKFYYANTLVEFMVNVLYNDDNSREQVYTFYINGEYVRQSRYGHLSYSFHKVGTYTIKVQVGEDAVIEKVIEVKDIPQKDTTKQNNLTVLLFCAGGSIIASAIVCFILNNVKKHRDEY